LHSAAALDPFNFGRCRIATGDRLVKRRPESGRNMAEFASARSYFKVLAINVTTMRVGLKPD
jgi:hypothetical protein